MKKIITIIIILICSYTYSQTNNGLQTDNDAITVLKGTEYNDYYIKLNKQISYSEAKYYIEISRKEFNLNRAYFNTEKQYFIFETLKELDKQNIKELFGINANKCNKVNPTEYINEIFEIRDTSIPHKISKFYIKH